MFDGNEILKTNASNEWWVFYPLTGLSITGPLDSLETPIFGDATIVSKEQADVLLEQIDPDRKTDSKSDLPFVVNYRLPLHTNFHSHLAIRRRGSMPKGHLSSEDSVRSLSSDRARGLAALLTVVFLASSLNGKTCCLEEQVHTGPSRHLLSINFNGPDLTYSSGDVGSWNYDIRIPKDVIHVSRHDVEAIFHQQPYSLLAPIITEQRVPVSSSLKKVLTQAVIRLADAIMSIEGSSQLLGAVTAIEMLLTQSNDKYESNGRRLGALLGKEVLETLDADGVFHSRHMYVHRGLKPERSDVAHRAIMLSMLAIFRYAYLAYEFNQKTALVDYLDFVSLSDRLVSIWEAKGKSVNFMLHERTGFDLPYTTWLVKLFSER